MSKGATATEMGLFERLLIRLDQPPVAALFRVIIGFFVVPTWSASTAGHNAEWTLIPFFLGILLALRLVPMVLRKVLPFSGAAKSCWSERRRLAKRFDSYQWQKLFWTGLGLISYMALSGQRFQALATLTSIAFVTGMFGLGMWWYRVRQLEERQQWTSSTAGENVTVSKLRSEA
jgi:hypothetical protein